MTNPIRPFLVIGQSLAEGRGAAHSAFSLPTGKLLRYYTGIPGGVPDNCADPAYPGHTNIGSPWPSFGWHLFQAHGQIPICLVFAPVGGSAVAAAADIGSGNWDASGSLRGAANTAMTNAMTALVTAGYTPLLPSVIQMGGQTDALGLYALPPLITVTDFITAELGLAAYFRGCSWGYSTMPFYCCSVGQEPDLAGGAAEPYYTVLQAGMERCADIDPFFKVVLRAMRHMNSHGLYLSGSHPNQAGNDQFGRLLAQAIANGGTDPLWWTYNISSQGPPDVNTLWCGPLGPQVG